MSHTVAYQDYSYIIESLNSAIASAKSAKPEEMQTEILRVIWHRERLVNRSPKFSNQMIHDRAARAMHAANVLIRAYCATPPCGCMAGECESKPTGCRMTVELHTNAQ